MRALAIALVVLAAACRPPVRPNEPEVYVPRAEAHASVVQLDTEVWIERGAAAPAMLPDPEREVWVSTNGTATTRSRALRVRSRAPQQQP